MLKTRFLRLAAAVLCGSITASAWAAETPAAQIYNATIKHVDVGGEYLQYQNFASTQAAIDQILDSIVAGIQDAQAQEQMQAILQTGRNVLNLQVLQGYATSIVRLPDGNYCSKEFIYLGDKISQPSIFSLLSRDNHAVQFQSLPADTLVAMECTEDYAAFYPYLMNVLQNSPSPEMQQIYMMFQMLDMAGNPFLQMLKSFKCVVSGYLAGELPDNLYGEITIHDPSGKLEATLEMLSKISGKGENSLMLPVKDAEATPWLRPVLTWGAEGVKLCSSPERRVNPAKLVDNALFQKMVFPKEGTGYFLLNLNEAQFQQLEEDAGYSPVQAFLQKIGGNILLVEVLSAEKDGFLTVTNSNLNLTLLNEAPVLAAGAAMLLPALSAARERARLSDCSSNLKEIGMGCCMYVAANDGDRLPDTLDVLLAKGYLGTADRSVFHCPSDDAPNHSYVYLGKGMVCGRNNPDLPVAFDKPGHHESNVNVLFLDGRVETITVPGYTHPRQVVEIICENCKFTEKEIKLLETNLAQY